MKDYPITHLFDIMVQVTPTDLCFMIVGIWIMLTQSIY